MAQAVKYQTTTIAPEKSASELAAIVRKYGGSRFEQRWNDAGELAGVRFAIRMEVGEVPVILTAKTEKITDILFRKTSMGRQKAREQAYRIAWRHLKDLTEQLLLATELGLRSVPEAFMADIEVWDDLQQETVTMAELVNRRAVIEEGERGLRLMPATEAPRVHQLPPARGA